MTNPAVAPDSNPTSTSGQSSAKSGAYSAATVVAVLTGLAVAVIHFSLVPEEFDKGATGYGTAFIVTGVLGLVGIIAAYVPTAAFAPVRTPARICLILLSIGSIGYYLYLGFFDNLGWVTKVLEVVLILAIAATMAADNRTASMS